MEAREAQNNIVAYGIGIDIATDYSQISYIAGDMKEPKSVSTIQGEKKYLIPTLMYKMKNLEEWYIGEQAKFKSFEDDNESYTVRNMLDRVYTGDELHLDGNTYTGSKLLGIYMEKLLEEAKRLEHISKAVYISVTVERNDKVIIDAIYEALTGLGYDREHIRVLSHTESFVYYSMSQKRELWTNDVALFDFNSEHFSYRRMTILRNRQPEIVTVSEKDYSENISLSYIETERDKQECDEIFMDIIKDEFYKQIISTVYLTGVGFYSDFAENSLIELCSKRRVFKGYNLFVKGACHDAYMRYQNKNTPGYIIQCEGRTKANIGLVIKHAGKEEVIALSNAGISWYEAGARAECILDDIKSIQLMLTRVAGKGAGNIEIDLSELPDRPNKTTRVAISMSFRDDNTFDVVVEDLGFGDFYRATDVVVRNTYCIDEILV